MTILTASRPAQPRNAPRRRVGRGLAIATLLVLLPVVDACSGPRFIERVTIVNPTLYNLDVDVTTAKRDGWLAIGHVVRESETTTEEVIDQGETWIFRFRHAGTDAGELTVSLGDLKRNSWRVQVPASVGDRLHEQGAEPSLEPDR